MRGEGSMSQTLSNLKSTLHCHFQFCHTIYLSWDSNIAGLQQFCIQHQGRISCDIHDPAEACSHPLCSSPTLYYIISHLNPLAKPPMRPWYTAQNVHWCTINGSQKYFTTFRKFKYLGGSIFQYKTIRFQYKSLSHHFLQLYNINKIF